MSDLVHPSGSAVERAASLGHCRYCGAPLAPGYYFCLRCATPHATVESVLPAVYVAPPTDGERIQRLAPKAWPLFWTYLGVVLGAGILGLLIFHEDSFVYSILLTSSAMFITTCIFTALHWPSLAVQFGRIGFNHWAAWAALAALAPLLGANYLFHELFLRSLVAFEDPMPGIREGLGGGGTILFICILPGIVEEIAFRGLLQHWLQVAVRPMLAVVLASALFAALHFSKVSFPYLFAVGMTLGLAKLKTNSLWPCMVIHFLHNLAVVELFPIL